MAGGTKNTSLLVSSQLPEFIANDYPKFVEFLQAYYKFQTENYNVAIEKLRDPDAVSNELLIFLRKELVKNFPQSSIDDRKLIGLMRQLYAQKGTVDGIRLLFQLFFNDIIIIHKPGEKILRASQSNWDQYNIITLSTIYWDKVIRDLRRASVGTSVEYTRFSQLVGGYMIGDISHNGSISPSDSTILGKWLKNPYNPAITQNQRDHISNVLVPALLSNVNFTPYYRLSNANEINIIEGVTKLVINNKYGRFTPPIAKFEFAENNDLRVYFSSYENVKVDVNETVTISGVSGYNKVVPSPSGLVINKPGKYWQKGQVIRIPGSVKDTVAKVTDITSYQVQKTTKGSGTAGEYTLTVLDSYHLKIGHQVVIGNYVAGEIKDIDGLVLTLDKPLNYTVPSNTKIKFNTFKYTINPLTSQTLTTIVPLMITKYDGGIKKIEIIEYGGAHDDNLSIVVSPYPTKPTNSTNYTVDSVVTSIGIAGNPNQPVYKHTISIDDHIEHIAEIIYAERGNINFNKLASTITLASQGDSAALSLLNIVVGGSKLGDIDQNGSIQGNDAALVATYGNFLSGVSTTNVSTTVKTRMNTHVIPKLIELYDYHSANPSVAAAYKDLLFRIVSPQTPVVSQSFAEKESIRRNVSEITMSEWVESRATLTFQKSAIVKDVGSYRSNTGLLSNSDSKLQDNYFYQLFSYVVETSKSGDDVRYVLDQFHPAGMKYFFQLYKKTEYSVRDIVQAFRKFSSDVLFVTSALANPTDEKTFYITKAIADTTPLVEALAIVFTKILADAASATDSVAKTFTKNTESILASSTDSSNKVATKNITTVTDALGDTTAFTTVKNYSEVMDALTDTPSKITAKYITNEAVSMVSLDNASEDRNSYSDGYFSEAYTQIVTTLTIG